MYSTANGFPARKWQKSSDHSSTSIFPFILKSVQNKLDAVTKQLRDTGPSASEQLSSERYHRVHRPLMSGRIHCFDGASVGYNRFIERQSHRYAVRRGRMTQPAKTAGDNERPHAPTPRQGTRSPRRLTARGATSSSYALQIGRESWT
jgi:hypothetical protein